MGEVCLYTKGFRCQVCNVKTCCPHLLLLSLFVKSMCRLFRVYLVKVFFEMVGVAIEELERYIALAKVQLKTTNESLAIAKTREKASVMATVKACSQMEDRNNHLQEAKELSSTLLIKMENNTE